MAEIYDQRQFPESVHGVDYLIDYYKVIGTERVTEPEEIKKIWRDKIRQYHPDRFQGLAPELATQAAQTTRVLLEADQILQNPQKRKEYDEKLSNWTGPISENGLPMIVLRISGLAKASILGNLDSHKKSLAESLEKGSMMVGFDRTTFDFIKKQYKSEENPSEELTEAYRQMLAKKNSSISLQEILHRDSLGIKGEPEIAKGYLEKVKEHLEQEREKVPGDIQNLVLQLTGEDMQLQIQGLEKKIEYADEPTKAVDHYTARSLEYFDHTSQILLDLAKQKEELIAERLDILRGNYKPNADIIFTKGIIEIINEDRKIYFSFAIENSSISMGSVKDPQLLEDIREESFNQLQDRGYNFVTVTHQDGLPLMDEMTTIISKHYELLKENEAKETA